MKPERGSIVRPLVILGSLVLLTALPFWLPWRSLEAFLTDPAGTRITDRTGALLSLVAPAGGELRENLDFKDIPSACRDIFVDLEDARFYEHPGIDVLAAARAFALRLRGGGSGASTITMQLARMVAPHAHTILGKALEAFRALQIESRLSKDRILALYLDNVPFGKNTRGIAAAAWVYFDSDLASLSPAQDLVLAVIPRNPTLYDPLAHPDALASAAIQAARRKRISLDEAEIENAVRSAREGRPPVRAPHFSRYVARRVIEGSLKARGGEVRTTLDLDLNDFIEERVRFTLERYARARVTNAAVVVIENSTGAVIGWVGSRDFSDAERSGQIDGALIRRQSASTLKPFLYARAIQTGWTPATLLPDSPIEFGSAADETYRPVNFDRRSRGVVRLRTALASSLNVPAVFTLSRVGMPAFTTDLKALGFTLPPDAESRYGLGMAIGNAEVSLVELTRAFTVFPRGGTVPSLLLAAGQLRSSARIYDPATAWLITSILSDPSARASGFGTRTYFQTPFPSIFKSGTSSEFTNLWCVGATPLYTVGVWAGNFDGRTVINKTGSIVPAQLAVDVLTRLTASPSEFRAPSGIVSARIDTRTGMRATPQCPSTRIEYFQSEDRIPAPCAYHSKPGSRNALVLESLLGEDENVRILFPVDGQVFYLDPTMSASRQEIPLVAVSRAGRKISVVVDGVEVGQDVLESDVTLPASRGAHVIVARTSDGEARAVYEVK